MTEREAIFGKIFCFCNEHVKPLIVGVNGVDTSGKTTFAKSLAEYFKAIGQPIQLVHLDDFHNPSAVRRQGKNEIDAYYNNAFNLSFLEKELLLPVKRGETFQKELCLLDLNKDTYSNRKTYEVTEDTVIIIEGVLLFREPVLQYLDVKIFLDISFEEVLKRAALRDVPLYGQEFLQRYKNKYIPIQQKYLAEWKPSEASDFVIDNNRFEHPQIVVGTGN